MSSLEEFDGFMRRIRAGDAAAATELVRRYEPLIRREVRLNLHDPRLRRVFDSLDVCQSVLGSFFVRTAAGQYDLDQPEQLVKLLVQMAQHKAASAARREQRQRRDHRRRASDGQEALDALPAVAPTPSEQVGGRELLDQVQARLTAEEGQLVELRGNGLAWQDIAQRLGGTAQARRMQLARALDRVALELDLEEAAP